MGAFQAVSSAFGERAGAPHLLGFLAAGPAWGTRQAGVGQLLDGGAVRSPCQGARDLAPSSGVPPTSLCSPAASSSHASPFLPTFDFNKQQVRSSWTFCLQRALALDTVIFSQSSLRPTGPKISLVGPWALFLKSEVRVEKKILDLG